MPSQFRNTIEKYAQLLPIYKTGRVLKKESPTEGKFHRLFLSIVDKDRAWLKNLTLFVKEGGHNLFVLFAMFASKICCFKEKKRNL